MAVTRIISGRCEPKLQSSALAILVLCIVMWGCSSAESRQESEPSAEPAVDTAPSSVVMGPEDGDHFRAAGGEFQIFVDPVTFPGARASFAKFGLGVGGALPVHRHDKTEEIGYFLSGEGIVTVYEGESPKDIPVREGYVVYIPPGSWHTIKNTGDETFSLVFATIPNEKQGLLSFFRRIGAKPGEEASPLSPEDFSRLAAEHDLILRPPDTAQ